MVAGLGVPIFRVITVIIRKKQMTKLISDTKTCFKLVSIIQTLISLRMKRLKDKK